MSWLFTCQPTNIGVNDSVYLFSFLGYLALTGVYAVLHPAGTFFRLWSNEGMQAQIAVLSPLLVLVSTGRTFHIYPPRYLGIIRKLQYIPYSTLSAG